MKAIICKAILLLLTYAKDGWMELGTREAGARQREMQKKYSVEFILYRLQKSTRVPRVKTFPFRIIILP